jgi:ABC-2 type transport system ATP-binding protein
MTSAIHPHSPVGVPGILLTGLTKSFGAVRAVQGINLDISPGETVALLGPNGAGKSTTIDLILGLAEPDAGTVAVFGRSPVDAVAAGAVGAMLQTGGLLRDLSVRELVTMMASMYPHPLDIDETIALTGIGEIADRRTQKLSGGQTQRVRFALALVSNPDLLVLDEPTVAMDVEVRRSFWESMRAFASRGKTVVFATHYLEEADAFADRIVLMARGRIVADGTPVQIKAEVGSRTIRADLLDVDAADLTSLVGVIASERHGDQIVLTCSDSDAAIRALLDAHPGAHNIEIAAGGLEQAFLRLTGDSAGDMTESTPMAMLETR